MPNWSFWGQVGSFLVLPLISASSELFPLIAYSSTTCDDIKGFEISSAPENTCAEVVTPIGVVFVLHKCQTLGLIQLFESSSCEGNSFLQTIQPLCASVGPVHLGICCTNLAPGGGSNNNNEGSWPLDGKCMQTVSPTPSDTTCRPKRGMTVKTCSKKINSCLLENRPMKWTKVGCRSKDGRFQDGGCQCDQYCGYGCKKACKKDKQCQWINGVCFNVASGEVGLQMEIC